MRTDLQRFVTKVVLPDSPDGCWQWIGGRNTKGYGNFGIGLPVHAGARPRFKTYAVHRFSYETFIGPIQSGLTIDHLCRNRACVNPAHMEPVTHRVNVLRGTAASAVNSRKTHCKRGHPFTPENTGITKGTWGLFRRCRVCDREKRRKPAIETVAKR